MYSLVLTVSVPVVPAAAEAKCENCDSRTLENPQGPDKLHILA